MPRVRLAGRCPWRGWSGSSMLFAVVLHTDLPLGQAHIDAMDVVAKPVDDVDLCSSRPAAGAGQHQAGTRFLRRLRTDVGEPDHFAQLHNPDLSAVACSSASTRITASVRPYRRPWSKAFRAAVVTGMPRTISISSDSVSLCNTISLVLRWLACLSSAGKRESIHFALCHDAVCKSFGAQEWPVHANTTTSYLDRFRGETELVQQNRRLQIGRAHV